MENRRRAMTPARYVAVVLLALASACSNPESERLKQTTLPTYDNATGKLKELTFDHNKNGRIDTWTEMDGARPVLTRMDRDEDGTVDRWEYYDQAGKLVKVGFSRATPGKPDAWAYSSAGPEQIERIEISSTGDANRIDRWERYAAGNVLIEADEDTDRDGRPDKWETFNSGVVATVAFDEDRDGRPDRRLTYRDGAVTIIESAPDASGKYTKRLEVK
jgi:hypothetical protein